ncbi:MAG: phage tail protein [Lachnospiraceae bacterium]|nr:phage tail protein [Lachnospiraceae bacterium]
MLIGFKRMKIQPLNDDGAPDGTTIVVEGKANEGASQEATVSGISPEAVKVWGSDVPYYVSQKGTGDISVALTILDLPSDAEAKILGYEKDTELGVQFAGENTEPPYCAVTLESSDASGNVALFGFFKGKFQKGDLALKTRDGSSYTPSGDGYTYSVVASDREDKTKGQAMLQFFGAASKQAAVEALVFGSSTAGSQSEGE